jgi:DNA-binding response OmpR family regulator
MYSLASMNQGIAEKTVHDFVGKPKPDGVVLVVGPSASSALITARNLEAMGFTTDVVHSFSSALYLLKDDSLHHIPDLILVELNLASQIPEALRFPAAVKNQTLWGNIPMIVRSPLKDSDTIVKALKAGYCDYVICPTDKDTLKERISRVFTQVAEIEKLTYPLPIQTSGILRLEIELSAINEFGAEALSQNFLAPGTVFNLQTDLLQRFHLKEIPVRVINCEELKKGDWKYKLALGFVGISPALQQRFRQFAISKGKYVN